MMRLPVLALVLVLQLFVLSPITASSQNPRSPEAGGAAQLSQAQKLAEEAVRQQSRIQSQMAALAERPSDLAPADLAQADLKARVEDIARQRQQVIDIVTQLQAQLRELESSVNRATATGARSANGTIQQAQLQARANYAKQMLEAASNSTESAAAARLNDAAQQDLRIRQTLDSAVSYLSQAAVAAKTSPVNDPPTSRQPGIERLLVLPPTAKSKASIEGIVLVADTGKPISDATVTLSRSGRLSALIALMENQPPPEPIPPTATDASGRFAFQNLDADSYLLTVNKPGYVLLAGHGPEANELGTPIKLDSGMEIRDLNVSLARRGNLSGRVRDINGNAARGVPVQLLRSVSQNGSAPTLRLIEETRSDTAGEYRLNDIVPGSYIVAAGSALSLSPLLQTLNSVDGEFGHTFYPGTSRADLAKQLVISGNELRADFSLNPEQRHRIRGRVIEEPGGSWPAVVTINLRSVAPTGLVRGNFIEDSVLARYEPRDGTFEVSDLLPGAYTITLSARIGEVDISGIGSVTVVVGDSDVEGTWIVLPVTKTPAKP